MVSKPSSICDNVRTAKLRDGSRHVRFQDELQSSEVRIMAATTRSLGDRRVPTVMEKAYLGLMETRYRSSVFIVLETIAGVVQGVSIPFHHL